ncbi:hypothetical protein [Nocardioides sp. SR21]|uniref:hypothetical protein n=1 Tax=Nocardioides sp. SR21 TaxID=2919501 RepID=UPI001FAB079F|nr:hypothetical protein [Nocardioides sp. SR21]
MEHTNIALEAEANRHQLAERIARAGTPKLPATAHRHLLAQRLHRIADKIDN